MLKTLALGLCAWLVTPAAFACTCVQQSIDAKIERADHVFRARVSGWERTVFTIPGTELEAGPFIKTHFEVIDVLKGEPDQVDTVYVDAFFCGRPLEVGHDYVFVVFVDLDLDFAFTGGCGSAIDLGFSSLSTPAWAEFRRKVQIEPDD